jgi:tRNA (cmo5U34)-methyltransferase
MKTTNVKAENLNYDHYESDKYDADIRRVIPGHEDLHKEIDKVVSEYSKNHQVKKIADLGIGTGLTAERILKVVSGAKLVAVDFSGQMLGGAKQRLAKYDTQYILGDYSEIDWGSDFDIVTSVIGIHHQNSIGKKKVFQKIYNSLKEGGIFIFGDLTTTNNKEDAAYNDARHYHHMVVNAENDTSLREWAYHHKFLNDLASIEDQLDWLKAVGFKDVGVRYRYLNTALIIATK